MERRSKGIRGKKKKKPLFTTAEEKEALMALIGGERGEKALRRMFSRMCMTYYLWSICKASQGGETNFLF